MAVGMSALRSPAWLHIDVTRSSLLGYAVASGRTLDSEEQCPPLDLFNDHARYVLARDGIDTALITGTVQGIAPSSKGWCVNSDQGSILAREIVLALGSADGGHWPGWARSFQRRGVSIEHVLETTSSRWKSGPLAIVGGGLSAAQAALAAASRGQCVTMFARRSLRIAAYDTHPRWFNDDALVEFRAVQPLERRQSELVRGRNPGTVTAEVASVLDRWLGDGPGRITLVHEPIESVAPSGSGVKFTWRQGVVETDHVLLATGFERHVPGERWIRQLARTLGLPLSPRGQPIPDERLQWAPGLHVCGALAELQLGPAARGLAGGRLAARIISQSVCYH